MAINCRIDKNMGIFKLFNLASSFSLSFFLLACHTPEDCPRYLIISASINPALEEYHIGDTILIISKFDKYVSGVNSDLEPIGEFNTEGMQWSPATAIFRIDTLGQATKTSVGTYFEFIENEIYNYHLLYTSDISGIAGEYNYGNDSFDLEVKLIPKKVGTFFLRQGSGIGISSNENQNLEGHCKGSNPSGWVSMNGDSANNIELLSESPDPYWNTWVLNKPVERFQHVGGYCFKVVK